MSREDALIDAGAAGPLVTPGDERAARSVGRDPGCDFSRGVRTQLRTVGRPKRVYPSCAQQVLRVGVSVGVVVQITYAPPAPSVQIDGDCHRPRR